MALTCVLLVVTVLSNAALSAADYTDHTQRCRTSYNHDESLRRAQPCSRGQDVVCDAVYWPAGSPQQCVLGSKKCRPEPRDLSVKFYQHQYYLDDKRLYTGANMTWTVYQQDDSWAELIGFWLNIVPNTNAPLSTMPRLLTINISESDFVDGKINYSYDCGFPLKVNNTGRFSVAGIYLDDEGNKIRTTGSFASLIQNI